MVCFESAEFVTRCRRESKSFEIDFAHFIDSTIISNSKEYLMAAYDISTEIVTLTSHVLQAQHSGLDAEATGDLTILLTAIQTTCKFIATNVRRAGLLNLYVQFNSSIIRACISRQPSSEEREDGFTGPHRVFKVGSSSVPPREGSL
jgi:hypothetical protein